MWDTMEPAGRSEAHRMKAATDLALLILWLLGASCGGRNVAFEAHVDYQVAIVLVIVGDVVHEHGAADGFGRASAINIARFALAEGSWRRWWLRRRGRNRLANRSAL